MIDYRAIKRMAKKNGILIKDLLALDRSNDPFYIGTKSQIAAADWFVGLWREFGYGDDVHLRRVHYRAMTPGLNVLLPSGKPYENTLNDWGYLCKAGKYARYLDLVSPTAFVDRRNPEAQIHTTWDATVDPTPEYKTTSDNHRWGWYELPELPELDNIGYATLPDLPDFAVSGYDDGIQQDYHLEIWVEKTTMNDVLEPLCERYNVNLVTGAGEMSITAVVDFMARVRDAQRPARILYISDYDPAGLGMPISVARKIEFFQRRSGDGDGDIRLLPIALTSEQVRGYNLPRVPVKDEDLRKANWERDHGQGQVELDALEALYPGDLAHIVKDTILGYYDPDLERNARRERERLTDDLGAIREALQTHHQDDIDSLNTDYQTLRDDFDETREKFAEMAGEFAPEVEAYQERLQAIVERGQELYTNLHDELTAVGDLDTDDYPLPTPDLPQESGGSLYVSERGYMDQIEAYKSYRHNE